MLWTQLGGDSGMLPTDVDIDADSEIVILGYGYGDPTWAKRYDAAGDLLDENNPTNGIRYGSILEDGTIATCGQITGDGIYGGTMDPIFEEGLWELLAPDPGASVSAYCSTVEATPDGNFVVAGFLSGQTYNGFSFMSVLTTDGDINWAALYTETTDHGVREVVNDVAVAADGRIAMVGYTDTDPSISSNNHGWIQVYEADGTFDWGGTYGEADEDVPTFDAAAWDNDNDRIIVVGREAGDTLLRAYDGDGGGAENHFFDTEGATTDYGEAVAVDANGHIVVVSDEERSDIGESWNIRVRKLDGDFDLLWEQVYNGEANAADTTAEVAIDPADNSIVLLGRDSAEGFVLRKFNQ